MLQGAALGAGEDGGVDLFVNLLIVAEDQAAPGAPQGLMGGGGHHMGIGHRGRVDAGGHKTGDVGHIYHQVSPHGIGHLAELGKVDDAGIGGGTGHDQFGPAGLGGFQEAVIVDALRFIVQAIRDYMEILSRNIHRAAVGQVSAMGQIHAQNGITGLYQGEKGGKICIGAGMWLDVGVIAAEQLTGTFAGDFFHHVHGVAAAVVAFAGITFGVLVGQARAHGGHHGGADDVFGSNQLNIAAFPVKFLPDGGAYLGVEPGDEVHGLLNHGEVLLFYQMSEICGGV